MAKKNATPPELTPAQDARNLANRIVELEAAAKTAKEQADELKAQLIEYVVETGDTDLGALIAEKRNAKPAIDFGDMTPKQKAFALEQLQKELPEFVVEKRELDVEKMWFSLGTTPAVVNALKVRNLQIVQKETIAFKKPKE